MSKPATSTGTESASAWRNTSKLLGAMKADPLKNKLQKWDYAKPAEKDTESQMKEENIPQKAKKKRRKKKKATSGEGNSSAAPVPLPAKKTAKGNLDLKDFFVAALESQHSSSTTPQADSIYKPSSINTSSSLRIKRPLSPVGRKRGGVLVENPNTVAAERFVVRRGKEREIPKKKKPTKLKKVILQERKDRYIRELEEKYGVSVMSSVDGEQPAPNSIDSSSVGEGESTEVNGSEAVDSITAPSKEDKEEDNESAEESDESIDSDREDIKSDTDREEETDGQQEQHNNNQSGVPSSSSSVPFTVPAVVPKVPNRETPYRKYCNQVINKELNEVVTALLAELRRFYQRQRTINPLKAQSKRRLMSGLREVHRGVQRKKVKCVIVAPNIDEVAAPGGLDDLTSSILRMCEKSSIPVVYALRRNTLGKAMGKSTRMSVVGIIDYSGAEQLYKQMIQLSKDGRKKFKEVEKQQQQEALLKEQQTEHSTPTTPLSSTTPLSPTTTTDTSTANSTTSTTAPRGSSFRLSALAAPYVPLSASTPLPP